ncbi:CitMHS family citrate-Mg2+:H+ or citrate-Ca2+:H+ symporter [Tamaricihabitans halophyticus]|uniref:CitMHS family citrate-Mg2+:H+ or citrate-Ca2+:H+ symporter n=1 Tax=Tamaricihabitans halophyticus TaxID=1262583 RepID=A0A4R2QY04_9PSEU|nr:CitMHS family citrate-Mg2+:H+ or citrate-Ca2+:H+ symporter [Tamaricihabitans halophyticus]
MLTALGFGTVAVILLLLLTSRVAAIVALIAIPVLAALVGGFGLADIGEFVTTGIGDIAGVLIMFVFAILYFGVMRDAGLFDPIVRRVLRFAGHQPVTIVLATALLAMCAHLDGAGATTFLITIPALLPLYEAMGMSRLVLATVTGLGAGVMNMLPWGGPTARAATVVGVDANELWVPLIPAQAAGVLAVLGIAYLLGRRERNRLGVGAELGATISPELPEEDPELRRPRLFWVNVALTVLTVGVLISGVLPPQVVFMISVVLALVINYPGMRAQQARVDAHARGAILMASTLAAAGAFLGIMEETGMTEAMARSLASIMPDSAAPLLPLIIGALGVPLSFLFGPDPYYYGVLPILTSVGEQFGIDPTLIAQASLTGEETVGFPLTPMTASFFLLVGLAKVDIGKHIRHMLPWAWGVNLVILAVAVATGVVPLWAG